LKLFNEGINMKEKSFPHTLLTSLVSIGEDVLDSSAEVLRTLGITGKAGIVCDSITRDLAGRKIAEVLEEGDYQADILIITEADMANVEKVREEAAEAEVLFGVGGGRPIDVAKYTAHLLNIPFISVPTAASHDGVASGRASINVEGRKSSLGARVPAAVLADTSLISSAPRRLNVSGAADIVSNITAVNDWYLAERIKGERVHRVAAELALLAARRLLQCRDLIRDMQPGGVKVLMEAIILSGTSMAVAGSSRPASGAEHLISHSLDSLRPSPGLHGEQCGLSSILTAYLQGADWRGIRDFLEHIGAPVKAVELGVDEELFLKAVTEAHRIRPERYTILGDGITLKAARRAARATGIFQA